MVSIRWVLPDPDGPTISRCSAWPRAGSAPDQAPVKSGPSSDHGTRSGMVKFGSARQSAGAAAAAPRLASGSTSSDRTVMSPAHLTQLVAFLVQRAAPLFRREPVDAQPEGVIRDTALP